MRVAVEYHKGRPFPPGKEPLNMQTHACERRSTKAYVVDGLWSRKSNTLLHYPDCSCMLLIRCWTHKPTLMSLSLRFQDYICIPPSNKLTVRFRHAFFANSGPCLRRVSGYDSKRFCALLPSGGSAQQRAEFKRVQFFFRHMAHTNGTGSEVCRRP